jgi:hypothetical protein
MDGVFEIVEPGGSFTYEFPARPYGMHLYHCHATPLKKHIAQGLYGAFIIDPPSRARRAGARHGAERLRHRRRRREQLLRRQRPAFYYAKYPIRVRRSQTVRIYLANLTEFDLINSFHLHGDFFRYYPTGSSDHFEYTDTVMLCQGQRGIIEIDFAHTGRSCSTRTSRSSPSSAGWASSRSSTDGLGGAELPRGWRLWRSCRSAARRRRRGLRGERTSLLDLVGRAPPPADQFDIRRVEFKPGEIRIRVTNPQRQS